MASSRKCKITGLDLSDAIALIEVDGDFELTGKQGFVENKSWMEACNQIRERR